MAAPLKIYLDSNDFSILSDPAHLSRVEIREIKSQLFQWKAEKKVNFFYSAVHVIEAAAVETQHTHMAKERANLIHELCGRNVFEIFPEVLKRETLALTGKRVNCNFSRNDGRWFQFEIAGNAFSNLPRLTIETLRPEIEKMGIERWELVKKKPSLQKELLAAARAVSNRNRETTLAEIMSTFSIDYADADFINQYMLGLKKRDQLSAYLLERFRDPTFLIQMRPSNYNGFNQLFEWMRSTSKSFHETLISVIETVLAIYAREEDGKEASRIFAKASTGNGLQYYASQLYEHMARNLVTPAEIVLMEELTFKDFIRLAPGSYTFVSVAMDAICRSLTTQPRRPKESDLVDMFHSFYAPYVDIYRTDGFMAPITEKYVKQLNTTVVGKLTNLPDVVQNAFAKKSI